MSGEDQTPRQWTQLGRCPPDSAAVGSDEEIVGTGHLPAVLQPCSHQEDVLLSRDGCEAERRRRVDMPPAAEHSHHASLAQRSNL